KVTLPAGGSVLGALPMIVAVNVTGSPKTVGLFEVVSEALVVPWLLVSGVVPTEGWKLGLAFKAGGFVCVAPGTAVKVRGAFPFASNDFVPIGVTCPRPSLAVNVTVPKGMVVRDVTVAV